MSDAEARIRELAHQIWESEGKPEGQHERHWLMACKLAAADEQPPIKPRTTRRVVKPKPLDGNGSTAKPAAGGKTATARTTGTKTASAKGNRRKKPLQEDDPAARSLDNPRVGTHPDPSGPGGKG